MRWVRGVVLALVSSGLAGCASPGPRAYTPSDLRGLWSRSLPAEMVLELEVPFEADAGIVQVAEAATRGASRDVEKLDALLREIFFAEDDPLVRYRARVSTTARETLERREGNCGSLANLFVAMARSVGLRARFVDASRRVSDVSRRGDHILESGHLTAGAWTAEGFRTIDFDPGGAPIVGGRILDDREGIAHHYNNRGYELLQLDRAAGRPPGRAAVESFELALAVWPTFARAHNNLGVITSRQGALDAAVEHYRAALAVDPEMSAAHANLAGVARARGDLATAESEYRDARRLNPANPYLWLSEGLVAHERGRCEVAEGLLRGALERAPDDPVTWVSLVQLETSLGKRSEAVGLLEDFLGRWPDSLWARLMLQRLISRAP